ncbi:copper amine oxidase domain protein [Paenibacillus curdlanolyticus YK9]|uniref:Copper amine oxidase domain protein n=1 Tax=Paenibacillus curdlanolyticus YK9 TaxID=717606 RepID=E0IA19_9BACL|nr:copper amine oxidase N-terminal domain-containing protein [Paenibacillus curdlanolyticus]EFM10596.1 copper amine oxidase domain protein [Paenibacillus curdlanolyticus YK9]
MSVKMRKALLVASAALVVAIAALPAIGQANAAANGQSSTPNAANKQKPWINHVIYNGYERSLSYPLLIEPGRVWMGVYDMSDLVMEYRREFDEKTGKITFTNPWRRIELQVGSKTALINGNKVMLAAAPKRHEGTVYLPVQLLTQLLGQEVTWDSKTLTLTVHVQSRVLAVGWLDVYFWVDKLYGNIYKAKKGERAVLISRATKDMRTAQYMEIDSLQNDRYLLRVLDRYAEPTQITKLLIEQNQLIAQAAVSYPGSWGLESIERSGNSLIMIDGLSVQLAEPGVETRKYNMKAYGVNEPFAVEAVFDDAMLVRAYSSRTLLLVDLREKKTYALYKLLLDEKEQKFIDDATAYNDGYPGDQLKLSGRKGDILTFKHTRLMEPFGEETLTFALPREVSSLPGATK